VNKLADAVQARKPEDLISPDQKDQDWRLQYLKWIWYDYDQSQTKKMFFANRGRYQIIKDYAMGKQSIDIYKPLLDIADDENDTELNIDWSIIPIYPKFRRIALRKLNKIGYNIVATPIDALAQDEKNKKYAQLKAKIVARKALEEMGSPIAQSPKLQPKSKEPADERELEIMFTYDPMMGMAMEMEEGIELVFYQNDIKQLSNQWKEDVMDFGVCLGRNYIDSNGFIRIERIDPEMYITNDCRKKDFSDRTYAGAVKEMTLADLKQLAQDQFSASEYEDIAKNVMGNFGNPSSIPRNISDPNIWFDSLKIWVLDAEWFSVNQIEKAKIVDKRGNLLIGNAYVDKAGKLRGELVRSSYKVVYKGMWIIGTNYVFNDGLKTNMLRSKSSLGDTDLSFKAYAPDLYKMDVTTVSEMVIPIINEIQMDWYHLQNVKNEAVPKGIAIEMSALENVPLGKGGAALDPLAILSLFKKKGVLVYRRIEENGTGQEIRPLEELQNGISTDAQFYFDSIQANINLLQQVAGFNDLTDGSTPNPKMLTTIANMAYEATDNALGHIMEADKWMLEKLASESVLALQDLVSMGADVSGYVRSLGDVTPRFIKLSKNVSNYEYGIKLEDKPTDQERQLFLQEAEAALKTNQIKYSDLIYVRSIDNLKQAQMVLGYLIDKWAEEQQKRASANTQDAANAQVQSGQAVEQAKQQTMQMEWQLKAQYKKLESELDMKAAAIKHQYDVELKQMDNNTTVTTALVQADSQEHVAEQKNLAHQDADKVLDKTS